MRKEVCVFFNSSSRSAEDRLRYLKELIFDLLQSSVGEGYLPTNDTRMCAAEWCMKIIVHSAIDNGEEDQRSREMMNEEIKDQLQFRQHHASWSLLSLCVHWRRQAALL